jgi:hypothetical protein
MSELKRCPFCGCEADWNISGAERDLLSFGCSGVSRCVRWMIPFTKPYYENALQIATERWNNRTPNKVEAERDAAIEAMSDIADGNRCRHCMLNPDTCENGQVYACGNFKWRGLREESKC